MFMGSPELAYGPRPRRARKLGHRRQRQWRARHRFLANPSFFNASMARLSEAQSTSNQDRNPVIIAIREDLERRAVT